VLQFEARPGSRTMAFVAETAQHPGELFLVQGPGERPRRVTDSNPWLSEIRLARQEVVRFKARDGLALEGILIRPLDARQGQRVPLILTVHGGPESHDRNGWKTSYANAGQLAAGRGFAVFYPNYRGSTGRGVAFSKLGQNDAAGKEFDDLVDAVDHLVGIGLVDRAKVGITGGSYGGYASAWGATYHTDRFAAAVMFVGISDKISKVGTTDIANEEYLVHARKRPWEAWQFFLERSPIYHASKSKTPILILHGKADPRVNPTQSLELYRHLKLHGKTVRLVWYPGEQHGNRRAASRLDYNLRLMQWMEHYLQGPGGAPPPYELKYPEPAVAVSSR
jgi:dipeptidyl aminopeptidase/acylaminoacyl peptidase